MTSDDVNRSDPSDETSKKAQELLQKPPALSQMQLLLRQVEQLSENQGKIATATQHNDALLIDAVANLEMRVNLVMAILHDLANQQVKFEGREQHRKDNRVIDVAWYYEQYMLRLKEEEAKAKAVEESKVEEKSEEKTDYPEDAVIFGGT